MKLNKKLTMKKIIFLVIASGLIFTSCEDFLEETSTIGLSAEKLTDISSMNSLNAGAFNDLRSFYAYQPMITTSLVRDIKIRRSANWIPFYKWTSSGIPPMFSGNSWNAAFRALNKVNTVLNSDIDNMYGTAGERASVKGDAFFIRAAVYFQLNNYFTNPNTGISVPLVTTVLGTNDRVPLETSEKIRTQIESDIEAARTSLLVKGGVNSYAAATAMAARIYFYHGKYNLAYERANEVITDGGYSLETNLADIYTKGNASSEVIYSIITNLSENNFGAGSQGFEQFQADEANGTASVNINGLIGKLRAADPVDKRFTDLMKEGDGLIYANGKYPNNAVDYIGIRLAEMYLTRAESNIMVNNSVSADDVSDVNMIKNRAGASDVVSGLPNQVAMLEIIFNERSKELCFEWGDRFLNTRRLKKDIINESGDGYVSHSQYNNLLYYLLPNAESRIQNW
tara:strand:- start:7985 stop:9349 length:1365 start_codon:yes stop_codon:yes gene_type:complete